MMFCHDKQRFRRATNARVIWSVLEWDGAYAKQYQENVTWGQKAAAESWSLLVKQLPV